MAAVETPLAAAEQQQLQGAGPETCCLLTLSDHLLKHLLVECLFFGGRDDAATRWKKGQTQAREEVEEISDCKTPGGRGHGVWEVARVRDLAALAATCRRMRGELVEQACEEIRLRLQSSLLVAPVTESLLAMEATGHQPEEERREDGKQQGHRGSALQDVNFLVQLRRVQAARGRVSCGRRHGVLVRRGGKMQVAERVRATAADMPHVVLRGTCDRWRGFLR